MFDGVAAAVRGRLHGSTRRQRARVYYIWEVTTRKTRRKKTAQARTFSVRKEPSYIPSWVEYEFRNFFRYLSCLFHCSGYSFCLSHVSYRRLKQILAVWRYVVRNFSSYSMVQVPHPCRAFTPVSMLDGRCRLSWIRSCNILPSCSQKQYCSTHFP